MISRTAVHALTALSTLALLPDGAFAGAGEIAQQTGAPRNYLGKLLKTLADAGIVESQKGRGGGFRLARHPAAVSLFEALEPIDHVSRWAGCFLGRGSCSDGSPCAVHHRWGRVRDLYLDFLRRTSIADLTAPAAIAANGQST